jgi:hypothetical protein
MFNNPKELDTYWLTGWWLEYIPRKETKTVEDDGEGGETVTSTFTEPTFSTTPKMFRYKFHNSEGINKEEFALMSGRIGIDAGAVIETRSKFLFTQEDLFLDNLELLPYGQENRFGLRYANWSRISNVKEQIDEQVNMSNLMFRTRNEIVKVITIG